MKKLLIVLLVITFMSCEPGVNKYDTVVTPVLVAKVDSCKVYEFISPGGYRLYVSNCHIAGRGN